MLDDIAILTGGKVLARDLGGKVESCQLSDLGSASNIRISSDTTIITKGHGEPEKIAARREQVRAYASHGRAGECAR